MLSPSQVLLSISTAGKEGPVLGASIPQHGLPWKQFKNVEPEMNLKIEKML
jgi:hypothetical protein